MKYLIFLIGLINTALLVLLLSSSVAYHTEIHKGICVLVNGPGASGACFGE